ncbi:MFS transporter [Sphingomonas sp. R647]|uniref:MFS transporter n=1 Tax=Sphingomonas sp. R647 TaxID=2875233 RepID=UPI001CD605E9|nr:MFS transporter [Sphingomonas sp. R647]MCA1197017.1 MFS transporter [Sphingomonas sp. R647]
MARRTDSLALIAAVVIGNGIAHIGTSTMPLQVGALMDLGLNGREAGLFGFFQIGALALSMIALAPFIHRARSVTVAMIGATLALGAHVLMYFMPGSFALLLVFAALAGTGYGLVFAATITGGSTAANPDRVYAIGNGGAVAYVVALMFVMPLASIHLGRMGAFLAVALAILITMPMMLAFRARTELPAIHAGGLLRQPAILALMLMWAGYSLGTGALWSFAERIAKGLEIAPTTTATILSLSALCGIAGTVVAAWLGGRAPRVASMVFGLIGTGVSCLLMGFATGAVMFAIGVLTYWIFYMYQYSVFLGVAAAIDPSGRAGTMGGGWERFAFAIGAPIGGLVADFGSYSMLGILGFLSCVLTIPLCMPLVARRLATTQPAPA